MTTLLLSTTTTTMTNEKTVAIESECARVRKLIKQTKKKTLLIVTTGPDQIREKKMKKYI